MFFAVYPFMAVRRVRHAHHELSVYTFITVRIAPYKKFFVASCPDWLLSTQSGQSKTLKAFFTTEAQRTQRKTFKIYC